MYRYSTSSAQSTFRSSLPLSNDEIARYAPSVLAESAHESRGERYTFIPTINVIDGLRKEGFQPYEVRQTQVRDASKREHTKHLVRLRHASTIADYGNGTVNEVPELILLNSHDGSSSYQLLAGFFRFVCSNGLISGDVKHDVRVRHSGRVVDDVIEGSFRILEDVQEIGSRIDTYKAITLSEPEVNLFASSALELRWDKPITTPERIVQPRRWADNDNNLWTVFNRVQENLVRGGVAGRTATGRRTHTRGVGGVTENVKLNRALWSLADNFAKLKQGVVDIEEVRELAVA